MSGANIARAVEDSGNPGDIGGEPVLSRAMAGREERVIEACDCVIDLAAAFFNIPGRELRRPGRCADEISRVRQIAMYVAHVVLGLSMTEIGKGFGRDRTTVMHACHLIEDLRDDDDADRIIVRAERIVATAFRGRIPI